MNNLLKESIKKANYLINVLFFSLGIACILYFILFTSALGYFNLFSIIWVFAGILFFVIAKYGKTLLIKINKKNRAIKIITSIFILIIVLSFVIVEIFVIYNAKSRNYQNADYLIILGAGLDRRNPSYPSVTLARRIRVAINYSRNNPDVMIIVSGGTGRNNEHSEAEIMSRVLLRNNIDSERIIIEDRSSNTLENLSFSSDLIENLDKKVVIVSCDFHLFRARLIANKIGFTNIGTLASRTKRVLLPHYYVREYFAIIKELFVGNI